MNNQELIYTDPAAQQFSLVRFLKSMLSRKSSPQDAEEEVTLSMLGYDGLNPLLAKQLTEVESQIGQLVQAQFEISQERSRMRSEMEELKKSVLSERGLMLVPQDREAAASGGK